MKGVQLVKTDKPIGGDTVVVQDMKDTPPAAALEDTSFILYYKGVAGSSGSSFKINLIYNGLETESLEIPADSI